MPTPFPLQQLLHELTLVLRYSTLLMLLDVMNDCKMSATEFCDPIPLAYKSPENATIRNQRTQFAVLYVTLLSVLPDPDVLLQVGQLTYLAKLRAGLRQNNNLTSDLRRNILSTTICPEGFGALSIYFPVGTRDFCMEIKRRERRILRSRCSSVGIATRYRLDNPARFSAPVHIGCEVHPASYTMGTGSLPGVNWTERDVDHPTPI